MQCRDRVFAYEQKCDMTQKTRVKPAFFKKGYHFPASSLPLKTNQRCQVSSGARHAQTASSGIACLSVSKVFCVYSNKHQGLTPLSFGAVVMGSDWYFASAMSLHVSYITCSHIALCLFPSECSLTKLNLAWRRILRRSEKHSMNHQHTHPSRVVMFLPVPGIVIRRWLAQIYSCLSCRLATTLCSTPFSKRTHNCTSPPSNLPPRERKSSPFVKFLHRRWGFFFQRGCLRIY